MCEEQAAAQQDGYYYVRIYNQDNPALYAQGFVSAVCVPCSTALLLTDSLWLSGQVHLGQSAGHTRSHTGSKWYQEHAFRLCILSST
jgi:hypothetical protein